MEPSRTFVDSQGLQWRVTERTVRRSDQDASRRCLFFEAPHVIRRVCHYPPDWMALSAMELEALSWRI